MELEPEITVVGLVFFEVFVPDYEPPPGGREVFVPEIPLGIGGAANTASVAHALGMPTRLIYPAGEGLSDGVMQARLTQMGIDARPFPGPDDPAVTLVFTHPGEDRGFVSAAQYDALARTPALPQRGWIHVPGLAEAELLASQLAHARARGAKVSVSAGWMPEALERLREVEEPRWDLLVLNEDEARAVLGTEQVQPHALTRLAHDVVITRGEQGAVAWLGSEGYTSAAAWALAVDTTGAGDAFVAGFLSGRVRECTPQACLDLGHAAAARQLARLGGLADPTDYEDLKCIE